MSQSSEVDKATETVPVRLQKTLWLKIRRRAMDRGESGLSWLNRCAAVCLGVAEGGGSIGGVTRAAVEPAEGSVAGKNLTGAARIGAFDYVENADGTVTRKDWRVEDAQRPVDPSRPIQSPVVPRGTSEDLTCPKCGCRPASHRKGSKGNRCEAHPTCVWGDVPGDLT